MTVVDFALEGDQVDELSRTSPLHVSWREPSRIVHLVPLHCKSAENRLEDPLKHVPDRAGIAISTAMKRAKGVLCLKSSITRSRPRKHAGNAGKRLAQSPKGQKKEKNNLGLSHKFS